MKRLEISVAAFPGQSIGRSSAAIRVARRSFSAEVLGGGVRQPVVVIDGSNAASVERASDGSPKLHNILALQTYFGERGFATQVFVDATLKSAIDRPDDLEALLRNQTFRQSPGRGIQAAQFILETASQTGGLVVSNDRFNDFLEQFPALFSPPGRLLRFLIVRGNVQLANQAQAILGELSRPTRIRDQARAFRQRLRAPVRDAALYATSRRTTPLSHVRRSGALVR